MDARSLFDGYWVLLADESRTRLELFEKWLAGVPTRTATTRKEFYRQFDAQTAVACVPRSAFEAEETALCQKLLARNPHCQLILMLPHGAAGEFTAGKFDAWLQRPVYRTDLQSTIISQLKYGIYSHTLHEFYTLNADLARFGTPQLDTNPPETAPPEKLDRYQTLQARLDALQAIIDTPDIDAILRSLKLHNEHLTEPATDVPQTRASKYHPNRCPHCKLPWGVAHRNKLGTGCDRVGAYVWRCNRCNQITHGLGSSHRRVLR